MGGMPDRQLRGRRGGEREEEDVFGNLGESLSGEWPGDQPSAVEWLCRTDSLTSYPSF